MAPVRGDREPRRSPWPLFLADGSVSPPPSGAYHVTVDPSAGWKGLIEAVESCPEGGSVRVKAGEYVYGPGDMRPADFLGPHSAALLISSPVYVFGEGDVTFRPASSPPFDAWGLDPSAPAYAVRCLAPAGALVGISISAPPGADENHFTSAVAFDAGAVRLQSCRLYAPSGCGGRALLAYGEGTAPALVGCSLTGGADCASFRGGAAGVLSSCRLEGARESGLSVFDDGTAPAVVGNAFAGCRRGIVVENGVDAEWAPREGNTFEGMREEDVLDLRMEMEGFGEEEEDEEEEEEVEVEEEDEAD